MDGPSITKADVAMANLRAGRRQRELDRIARRAYEREQQHNDLMADLYGVAPRPPDRSEQLATLAEYRERWLAQSEAWLTNPEKVTHLQWAGYALTPLVLSTFAGVLLHWSAAVGLALIVFAGIEGDAGTVPPRLLQFSESWIILWICVIWGLYISVRRMSLNRVELRELKFWGYSLREYLKSGKRERRAAAWAKREERLMRESMPASSE